MKNNVKCPFCGCSVKIFISIYGLYKSKNYYAIAHPDNTKCIINGIITSSYSDKKELINDWNKGFKRD